MHHVCTYIYTKVCTTFYIKNDILYHIFKLLVTRIQFDLNLQNTLRETNIIYVYVHYHYVTITEELSSIVII